MSVDLPASQDAFEGGVVPESTGSRLAAGVMTGTSLDGIDVALIDAVGRGLDMRVNVLTLHHAPLGEVAKPLRRLSDGEPMSAAEIASVATALAVVVSSAIADACASLPDGGVLTCIAVHGQTVHHEPPHTWQLLNPAPIVAAHQVPVLTGQRLGDLAMAGRGAPLTPLSDWLIHRAHAPCVILNLGGFANATVLTGSPCIEDVRGRDLCPCNHLLDAIARRRLAAPFDNRGAVAMSGTPEPDLADDIERALAAAAQDRLAMGESDRHLELLDQLDELSPADAAATLSEALGATIGKAAAAMGAGQLRMAGGGVHHERLCSAIEQAAKRPTSVLPGHGSREAAAMAALALLELDGIPPSLPRITGRSAGTVPGGQWMYPVG